MASRRAIVIVMIFFIVDKFLDGEFLICETKKFIGLFPTKHKVFLGWGVFVQ